MKFKPRIIMKKIPTIIVVAAIVLAFTLVGQQQTGKGSGTHLGTWQLISTKYGDAKDFADFPNEQRRVKLITATHFTWIQYDTASKKVESMAGTSLPISTDSSANCPPAGRTAWRSETRISCTRSTSPF